MADVLPLDGVLEELVAALVDLTAAGSSGGEVAVTGAAWEAVFDLEGDAFFVDLVPLSADAFEAMDDYQLGVLVALGFDPVEEPGEIPLFRQEYDYDPNDEWDEEAIRQLGLLALGLLRDTFHVPNLEAVAVSRA